MSITPYFRALGIGGVAGLRVATAPAVLLRSRGHRFAGIATLAAAGELVVDKLPSTPARTTAPALVTRVLSGALCGQSITGRLNASRAGGAMAGAIGALAGAYGGYTLRRYLTAQRHWPDFPVALVEDVTAILTARAACR